MTSLVHLGVIKPEEVDVEIYFGPFKTIDTLALGQVVQMQPEKDLGDGVYLYACNTTFRRAGRFGFTARVRPRADGWIRNTPGFITWAE